MRDIQLDKDLSKTAQTMFRTASKIRLKYGNNNVNANQLTQAAQQVKEWAEEEGKNE